MLLIFQVLVDQKHISEILDHKEKVKILSLPKEMGKLLQHQSHHGCSASKITAFIISKNEIFYQTLL